MRPLIATAAWADLLRDDQHGSNARLFASRTLALTKG